MEPNIQTAHSAPLAIAVGLSAPQRRIAPIPHAIVNRELYAKKQHPNQLFKKSASILCIRQIRGQNQHTKQNFAPLRLCEKTNTKQNFAPLA
jgi:hypothetical protein